MKKLVMLSPLVLMLWTAVEPLWADNAASSVHASLNDETPTRLSDLGMHLNPQLGVSSFEFSNNAGGSKPKPTGGATVEFGGEMRKLETGLLILQTGANATLNDGTQAPITNTYLTLPMMAKLRVLKMRSQSWYLKFGALSAFQIGSSNHAISNPVDVMAAAGLSGRFAFSKTSDFIVEATYNRGFMDAVHSTTDSSFNQGIVILAGLSFRI